MWLAHFFIVPVKLMYGLNVDSTRQLMSIPLVCGWQFMIKLSAALPILIPYETAVKNLTSLKPAEIKAPVSAPITSPAVGFISFFKVFVRTVSNTLSTLFIS